ncbi:TM1812 family CRISPR-associated protein [Thermococcus waiotapuensis]|uniref:CRISPR system endoribonuclease Csx1-like HEPN domain-containing protein n=1 Tax=Thermococcus waiotapuensis TaxID=90909 RepID=A0AAE4T0Z6_9EURY|nr:hypothetical protein [Thermococcus waiotapuensis]MDV3103745.1 hypothetical protein [Thermococcus waiotapuensis]
MPLKDFLGFEKASKEISPRNFLAHAGLEANVTEVKMDRWEAGDVRREAREHTFLRYSQEARRRVEEMTANALGGV